MNIFQQFSGESCRMLRRVRRVFVGLVVLCWAICQIAIVCVEYFEVSVDDFSRIRDIVVLVATASLVVYRTLTTHPISNPKYATFLLRFPWDEQDRLPNGQVKLGAGDVLPAIVLTLGMCYRPVFPLVSVSLVYLWSFTVTVGIICRKQKLPRQAYGIGVLWVMSVGLLSTSQLFSAGLAIFVAVIANLSVAVSLRRFLEDQILCSEGADERCEIFRLQKSMKSKYTGVAFDELTLKIGKQTSPRQRTLDALMIGWASLWIFHLGSGLTGNRYETEWVACFSATALGMGIWLAGQRFVRYYDGLSPPITLFGRIFTGRFVHPDYDVGLVGPICTVLISIATAGFALSFLSTNAILFGLCIFLIVLSSSEIGPEINRFRLTAPARLTPPNGRIKEAISTSTGRSKIVG